MSPKKAKSPRSSAAHPGSRSWESALINAQLEEDSWRLSIAWVVENQPEDEVHTRALTRALRTPQRRLFSIVSWSDILQQVHELGNPKLRKTRDAPLYYEVTETAKLLLDNGESLPLPLISKLLKFHFLCIKQKDLQRRETERKALDGKSQEKTLRSGKAKPASAKGSAKTKGKKGPEAAAPIKKNTTLRRRGEEEDSNVYIDDEPDDGPQHYILVLGVYQPQVLALLADMGVNVSSVIRVSSQNYGSLAGHSEEPGLASEEERRQSITTSLRLFWRYLEPILETGKTGSALSQVARLVYLVKERDQPSDWSDGDQQMTYASEVFERIACLMYDCLDWRRQHQRYLDNLNLIHVPALGEGTAEQPPPSSEASVAPAVPASPNGKKRSQLEEIHPAPSPLTPDHTDGAVLAGNVDLRFYDDLLRNTPEELISVPVIVHCMLEQVVASQEDLVPPSEIVPEPRADGLDPDIAQHLLCTVDSLPLTEREKKNLCNIFLVDAKDEETVQTQKPKLLQYQNTTGQRSHQVQGPKTLNVVKIEEEMLKLLPIPQHSPLPRHLTHHLPRHLTHHLPRHLPPGANPHRLAHIHELMHYCHTGSLSLEEISRAFKILTLESVTLSGFDEFGEVEGPGKMLGGDGHIPWDDPAGFARDIFQMYKKRERRGSGRDCEETQDTKKEKEEEKENKEDIGEKETPRAELGSIQKLQKRCLSDWCYTEHFDPILLTQVLHDAAESYRCMDSYYYTQDNSLLIILHNPMDHVHQNHESWDMALHSNVSFRNYLELVADSIFDWVQEEEEKYQQEKMDRDLEAANQVPKDRDPRDPSPTKRKGRRSASAKKSKSPSRSRSGSRAEDAGAPEPAKDPFLREDSLKAWKMEQERLKEEELLKQQKKNAKLRKSGGRKKEERPASRDRKRSPSNKKKTEEVPTEDHPTGSPAPPAEEKLRFIGYDMGDSLIQVSGGSRCLYPTDGGQIQVEHIQFEKGSSFIKTKVLKDGHSFLIHITNPKSHPDPQDHPAPLHLEGRRGVAEFGSFSAALRSGIRLSFSHYGASGRGSEETDPGLEAALIFPSVHTPSVIPSPPSQPPPTPSGKSRKSPRAGRVKTPQAPPPEEPPQTPETKAPPPPTRPEPHSTFQTLNVSYPNGLLLTFLREDQAGVTDGHRLLVRQTYVPRGQRAEVSRVITAEGAVIRSMLDGSTQVLFPDGSISRSPDSGPISEPRSPDPSPPEPAAPHPAHPPASPEPRRGKVPPAAKPETSDPSDPAPATPGTLGVTPGTWVTTTPSGEQIGTRGGERLDLGPLLTSRATDPVTRAVVTVREDQVVTALRTDGTVIAEHTDGTRITTTYRTLDTPLPGQYEETGEIPQSVARRVKFIYVENAHFPTVTLNCEERSTCATSADGTRILAEPQGAYLVYPPHSGCLSISHEGRAIYSPGPNHPAQMPPGPQDLPPASYIMSHTDHVICEALDPEGNLFQVMVDGSTSVVISDNCEEEEETDRPPAPEVYDLHAPRFFMVHADGSGCELLRNREVEDFLTACYCDPATAVLREPMQGAPGVQSITVMQPLPETSPWIMKKALDSIVPPNLLSRSWVPSERRTSGPPLGIGAWRGLRIGSQEEVRPPRAAIKCPNALKIRQLHLYDPLTKDVREKLEESLREYINNVLRKEEEWRERSIKDPRTPEEKELAADLLKLVLSLPDSREFPETSGLEQIPDDISSVYENAVSPALPPPAPIPQPARSVQDWEKLRMEIQEQKRHLEALRKRQFPGYFQSHRGLEFLRSQPPDLQRLPQQLPPNRSQEPAPTTAEETPDISFSPRTRPQGHSRSVDVTGESRREAVKPAPSVRGGKPASVAGAGFAALEVPVNVRVTSSSAAKRVSQGLLLTPEVLQFGVLREGFTYAMTVTLKNAGPDFCRFRVKTPPPSTGLRVTYTPGPVAPGMHTHLRVELFALAVGLEGPEGAAGCSHCIEVQSEVETLLLPVTATVLTETLYERTEGGSGRLGSGVKLLSTTPTERAELLRPTKGTRTGRTSGI